MRAKRTSKPAIVSPETRREVESWRERQGGFDREPCEGALALEPGHQLVAITKDGVVITSRRDTEARRRLLELLRKHDGPSGPSSA